MGSIAKLRPNHTVVPAPKSNNFRSSPRSTGTAGWWELQVYSPRDWKSRKDSLVTNLMPSMRNLSNVASSLISILKESFRKDL